MIKKTYLAILSIATVSVLLGSLFYNNITFAGRTPTQVEVINFPTDEEGNLKTVVTQSSEIMLVFNETLTVPSSTSTYNYLTSFNTSGFKQAYIMARIQGTWQIGAYIAVSFFENNFGIRSFQAGISPDIRLNIGPSDTTRPDWGSGLSSKINVYSASIDLYLRVYNSDVGFDGLLTVAVHLSN